jgi:hypothetical protein
VVAWRLGCWSCGVVLRWRLVCRSWRVAVFERSRCAIARVENVPVTSRTFRYFTLYIYPYTRDILLNVPKKAVHKLETTERKEREKRECGFACTSTLCIYEEICWWLRARGRGTVAAV